MIGKGIILNEGCTDGTALVFRHNRKYINRKSSLSAENEVKRFVIKATEFIDRFGADIGIIKSNSFEQLGFGLLDKSFHMLTSEYRTVFLDCIRMIETESVSSEYAINRAFLLLLDIYKYKSSSDYNTYTLFMFMRIRNALLDYFESRKVYFSEMIDGNIIIVCDEFASCYLNFPHPEKLVGVVIESPHFDLHELEQKFCKIPIVLGVSEITDKIQNGDLLKLDTSNSNLFIVECAS